MRMRFAVVPGVFSKNIFGCRGKRFIRPAKRRDTEIPGHFKNDNNEKYMFCFHSGLSPARIAPDIKKSAGARCITLAPAGNWIFKGI